MNKFNIVANKEIRRQVIWWTIGIGFFLVPLLYAVIANDFYSKIENMLDTGLEVTGFGIIGIFIGGIVVFNFKMQAVEDVRENDEAIDNSYNDLYTKKTAITQAQIPLALKHINDENYKGQVVSNGLLTQKAITKKKNKLVIAQINGKKRKIKRLNLAIENLENNDKYDRKFKGLKPKDVLKTNSGLFNRETSYRKRYFDNPTATNWWLKLITTPLKFLTLAGSLVSSFALGISYESLFLFYAMIIITTAVFSLVAYIIVSNRVIHKTYRANLNMIEYIDDMMISISKPVVEEIVIPKEKTTN